MSTKEFFGNLKSRYVAKNLAMMAVVVLLLVVGVAVGTDVYTHHGEVITVPDIRNKRFADAERILNSYGLEIVVSDTGYNRQLPADCILQQTPVGGIKVKSGRVIYVVINSAENPTITLPDVVDNSSEREAMAKLSMLGFKIGKTQYVPGEKGWVYGIVCRGRNLNAGDKVPVDAMIFLQVGNGLLSDDAILQVTDMERVYDEEEEDPEISAEDPFEEVTE